MPLFESPHRRFNPLTGEWVLVSPHRNQRPWQGQEDEPEPEEKPEYDPGCYLCPGNTRANGEQNPPYESTFVFTNDFSALLPGGPEQAPDLDDDLLRAKGETGQCRVICYSPRHDLTLARMPAEDVVKVIRVWVEEYRALGARPDIHYVQVFENRGAMMGCSNPHPHGQIWAGSSVPTIPFQEGVHQAAYLKDHGRCMLCRYLEQELAGDERVVIANDSFVVLTPFWAVWPFEIMILPRRHLASIDRMSVSEQADLAEIMVRAGVRLDNLFQVSFPYSMGIHQAPTYGMDHPEWHFHLHYYPPLLRSRSIRKFMVGYEMMAEAQRDITAEQSAERLREMPGVHYLDMG